MFKKKEGIIVSKLVDEAVKTLRIANDKIVQLSVAFCKNIKTEPFNKFYLVYGGNIRTVKLPLRMDNNDI